MAVDGDSCQGKLGLINLSASVPRVAPQLSIDACGVLLHECPVDKLAREQSAAKLVSSRADFDTCALYWDHTFETCREPSDVKTNGI